MSLRTGLLGAAILFVGLFAIGRVVAKWLGSAGDVTPRKQWIYSILELLVIVVVMVGVPLLFRTARIGETLLPSAPPLAAALLNSLVLAAIAVLGLAVAWVGLGPFRRSRQWADSVFQQRRRLELACLIVLTLLIALIVEVGFLYTVPAPLLHFGSLVIAFGGNLFVDNLVYPPQCPVAFYGVREPTEMERERIEAVYQRLDIPLPDKIEVTINDYTDNVVVLGNSDHRVLALGESVFSDFDDDVHAVRFAFAEGRARHGVELFEVGHTLGRICSFATCFWALFYVTWNIFATNQGPGVVAYGTVLLIFACLLIVRQLAIAGKKRVHLADEYTVEHVEPSLITDVYRDPEKRHGAVSNEQNRNDGFSAAFELPIEDRLEHVGLASDGSD